jgi:hypothetical protein
MIRVKLHGTGYLIGRMYSEGHLSKEEAIAKAGEMRKVGWRLSEDDYRAIVDYLKAL